MSCALHNRPASLTMEKAVQCDVVDVVNLAETEKEIPPEIGNTNAQLTNGHAPFPATVQATTTIETTQPWFKVVSKKHACLQNILVDKISKDDMDLEILEFDTLKENRLNYSLNPFVSAPASLVTVVKFKQGEFVEVKSPSSYNSSISLWDMKSAIAAALDSSIVQSGAEVPVRESSPRSSPAQDVVMNEAPENNTQPKNATPKKSSPSKFVEGNTGRNENIAGTSGDSKGKPGSPKGNAGSKGQPKGTSGETKGTTEGGKLPEKRQRRTPEKVKEKNTNVSKEKAQPAKAKVEAAPAKPVQAKPPQIRAKKIKIPDEESIKFANRQREIQRLKKELKEKLKREGKDGVDPAARINAWGRTVGVTCTMCGNHVQKSYGCFRRDTAPEKLLHLFTPGMNRIKICRRCLPYKKQPGKGEADNRVLKPGLLSLPNDPRAFNPGVNPPITIAPLPDKPVSATTLNAIHRKVTGQETTEHETNVHVNIAGHVNTTPCHVNTVTGHVNNLSGHVNNGPGHISNVAGIINNKSGQMATGPIHVPAGSVHVNTNSEQVIDATEIDLSVDSSRGSAIEYIRKLALNLKTNYNSEPGENNMAAKTDMATPEEQIMKTPIIEQMANFTPVTPSMNLGHQVTNPVSVGANSVQWKPVLNQVAPVNQANQANQAVTPETTAGFVQATEAGNAIPTPPWSTVPLVLKTQPNIVFTSPGHAPHDPLGAPLQTFVTTANQKDVKLVPAIMVPSQNALPGQGPVLLQIQRVKLVRDPPSGGRQDNKNKIAESQGKQNEIFIQSEAGLSVPTYSGYVGNVAQSTAGHPTLPVQITSVGPETSISNFLSQTKEISPAQVEPSRSSFQALTDEIAAPQVESSTVDLQSIAGEISSTQVETSTGDIQKITEELASLIERTSGYRQEQDVNMVDTIEHLGAQQDVGHIEQEQSGKPSENLNVIDSKILESSCLQPNETIGEQILSSEDLGVGYSQHEPAVVLCGPADITTQGATMYPSGYQVTNGGQDGILEASTNSCEQNIFESQISEEYLPQVNAESLKEMSKSEQEAVESIKDCDVMSGSDKMEDKEKLDSVFQSAVKDDLPEVQPSENDNGGNNEDVRDMGDQEKNLEARNEDISVVTKEADEKLEERKEDVQEEEETPKKEMETLEKYGKQKEGETDLNIAAKVVVEKEQDKGTVHKGITQEKPVTSDENVPFDLRRSQRRAASPRKLSPSKSPLRKVEAKIHGTRQQRQKIEQHDTQKEKAGQHATLRDKAGQQGSSKDKMGPLGTRRSKAEQQGTPKDKPGQPALQRGKADRQGSQKDEKEPEATQGVKRKRPGRPPKPVKCPKL